MTDKPKKISNFVGLNRPVDIETYLRTVDKDLINLFLYLTYLSVSAASGSRINDTDDDTYVDTELNSDEDIIRFGTGDSAGGSAGERAEIDYNGLSLTSGLKLIFDGYGGDTYWKYNSTTEYLEGWIDGTKRIEL